MARRRLHGFLPFCFTLLASIASVPALPGPATRIAIVLPGQSFEQGVGVTGTPSDIRVRERFRVEVYAVDDFGNIDFAYQGPIRLLTDDPIPTYGQRFGTSVSSIPAATALTSGSLRLSLDGAPYRTVDLGSPATSQEVCDAIEAGNTPASPDWGDAARTICFPVSRLGRYQAFLETNPTRTLLRETFDAADLEFRTLTVDPSYGSAALLGLGGSANDPNDPNQPWEYSAARVGFFDVPPGISSRFSRGMAFFEVMHADHTAAGSVHSLVVEQSGVPPLLIQQSSYAVTAASLLVEQIVLLDDDRNGAMDRAAVIFNGLLDPTTLTGLHSQFELRKDPGPLQVPGESLSHSFVLIGDQAYLRSSVEVTFGTGIPTTGLDGVSFAVLPGAGVIVSAETGLALDVAAANNAPLIDGADPVLLSSSTVDTNGDGAPDQIVFQFSEEIHFAAGSGVSASAPFDQDPATLSIPSRSQVLIVVQSTGFDTITELLTLDGPVIPGQPYIYGADAIARSIQNAMRAFGGSAAALHFTARFLPDAGRYLLVSGIPGSDSAVQVQPTGLPGDAAPLLRLGPANGGLERAGTDPDTPRLEDFLVLSPFSSIPGGPGARNLLAGMTSSDIVVDGSRLILGLNNDPAGALGPPSFFYLPGGGFGSATEPIPDDQRAWRLGPLGALTDHQAAGLANPTLPVTSITSMWSNNPLHSGFVRIRDTDSVPDDGTITFNPGLVQLDATSSLPPMNSTDALTPAGFVWRQISGPAALVIQDPSAPFTETNATVAGEYVLELAIQVRPAATSLGFNSYLLADGSVRNRIRLLVLCSSDAECDDSDPCNGVETCDIPAQICRPGAPPVEVCDGADNDCDGLLDEGFDLDADGLTQCAGDCNDNDPGSKRIPGEVTGLIVSPEGVAHRFVWDSAADLAGIDTHYDVFSGLMLDLLPSGDFSFGACILEELPVPTFVDSGSDPPVSNARYFIVRAQNRCGSGTWGSAQRDLSVAQSTMACTVGPGGGCSPGPGNGCGSGFCVDSVCCDSACAASCTRCDLPASPGICSPEPAGTPDPTCDPYTCGAGACNTTCASDGDCQSGACCAGICLDPTTDPDHCGACGSACSTNNIGSPACSGGQCTGVCDSGWADCDGNKLSNGCEASLGVAQSTSPAIHGVGTDADLLPGYLRVAGITNCGGCGVTCDDGIACTTDLCVPVGGQGVCRTFDRAQCGEARCPSASLPPGTPQPLEPGCAGLDADGDGLSNAWESASVDPYTGQASPVGIDLNCDGRISDATGDLIWHDPPVGDAVKDIYLEYDYMSPAAPEPASHEPRPGVVEAVVSAFDREGIVLHVDPGHQALAHADVLYFPVTGPDHCATPAAKSFFDPLDYKGNPANFDKRRTFGYHYYIFGHDSCSSATAGPVLGTSGLAEVNGNDGLVSLGTFQYTGSPAQVETKRYREESGTLMHELGHNFGLHHGGAFDPNDPLSSDPDMNQKPNHVSSMNYWMQLVGIARAESPGATSPLDPNIPWRVDYSHGVEIPALNEAGGLDESLGLGVLLEPWRRDISRFSCAPRIAPRLAPATFALDWNCDGLLDTMATGDLNNSNGPTETLKASNEWAALRYDFQCQPSLADGIQAPSSLASNELTVAIAESRFLRTGSEDGCEATRDSCDGDPYDGCETDTATDPFHCGACGQACSASHITPQCLASQCAGACDPGFDDCNANKLLDGCEVDTLNDPGHCGGCGVTCAPGDTCVMGGCVSGPSVCSSADSLWSAPVGTGTASAPASDSSFNPAAPVSFLAKGSAVYAIRNIASDGQLAGSIKWTRPFANTIQNYPSPVPLRTGPEAVFVSAGDGFLYRLDAATGVNAPGFLPFDTRRPVCTTDTLTATPAVQLWNYSNSAFQTSQTDDLVMVITRTQCGDSASNRVYAIRAGNGTIAWVFNPAAIGLGMDYGSEGCSIDYANNHLYCGTNQPTGGSQHTLWAIDTTAGTRVWSRNAGSIHNRPQLGFGRLYVATSSGVLSVFDAATGSPQWSLPVSTTAGFEKSPALVNSGPFERLVVMTATDGFLHAIQDAGPSGMATWPSTNLGGFITTAPVVSPSLGKMYVGLDNGTVHQLSLATGQSEAYGTVGAGTVYDPSLDVDGGGPEINRLTVGGEDPGGARVRRYCLPWQPGWVGTM